MRAEVFDAQCSRLRLRHMGVMVSGGPRQTLGMLEQRLRDTYRAARCMHLVRNAHKVMLHVTPASAQVLARTFVEFEFAKYPFFLRTHPEQDIVLAARALRMLLLLFHWGVVCGRAVDWPSEDEVVSPEFLQRERNIDDMFPDASAADVLMSALRSAAYQRSDLRLVLSGKHHLLHVSAVASLVPRLARATGPVQQLTHTCTTHDLISHAFRDNIDAALIATHPHMQDLCQGDVTRLYRGIAGTALENLVHVPESAFLHPAELLHHVSNTDMDAARRKWAALAAAGHPAAAEKTFAGMLKSVCGVLRVEMAEVKEAAADPHKAAAMLHRYDALLRHTVQHNAMSPGNIDTRNDYLENPQLYCIDAPDDPLFCHNNPHRLDEHECHICTARLRASHHYRTQGNLILALKHALAEMPHLQLKVEDAQPALQRQAAPGVAPGARESRLDLTVTTLAEGGGTTVYCIDATTVNLARGMMEKIRSRLQRLSDENNNAGNAVSAIDFIPACRQDLVHLVGAEDLLAGLDARYRLKERTYAHLCDSRIGDMRLKLVPVVCSSGGIVCQKSIDALKDMCRDINRTYRASGVVVDCGKMLEGILQALMGTLKSQYAGGRREGTTSVMPPNDLPDAYIDALRRGARYHMHDATVEQRAQRDTVRARLALERSAAALHLQQMAARARLAVAAGAGAGRGSGAGRRHYQQQPRVALGHRHSRGVPEAAARAAASVDAAAADARAQEHAASALVAAQASQERALAGVVAVDVGVGVASDAAVDGGGGGAGVLEVGGNGARNGEGVPAVVYSDAEAEDSSSSGVMHVRVISAQPLRVPLRGYLGAAGDEVSSVDDEASTAVTTESEEKTQARGVRRKRAAAAVNAMHDSPSSRVRSASRAASRAKSSTKDKGKPASR